ncbi:hypothetical protein KEJ44_06985 [Candidatus Bathyarchaeota archaeon]|nr:hypothetical protein [Candidatus Bathyarchaeota archaeon]
MSSKYKFIYLLIGVALLSCILASLIATGGLPSMTLQSSKQPERLESRLRELADAQGSADEVAGIAERYGVRCVDGRVRVIIELDAADSPIPDVEGIQVEARRGSLVQAWVPVEKLHELAQAPHVKYIRAPGEALAE